MQLNECFKLVTSYLIYVLPLTFVINSVALMTNMFINACFRGKVTVTI